MFTCRQEARSKELLTGHWRAVKGNATHPGPGASSPPCPLLFPAGAAAQEESPGARGAGPASCAPNPPRPLPPPPGATGSDRQAHLLPPAPSPPQAVFWRSCDRDGFTRRGRTWREAPSLSAALATGAAEAARRPRWRPDRGSHFPSATARAQVRRAEPRRRGRGEPVDTPPRGVQAAPREEAAEPRLVRAEPSRAGAPSGPAPRDAAGPGLGASPGHQRGPTHAAGRACELRPAAWQPQVRRQAPGHSGSPPPARPFLSPALAGAPHFSERRPAPTLSGLFGAGICVLSVLFPSSLSHTSHPDFPTFLFPASCAIPRRSCLTLFCPRLLSP